MTRVLIVEDDALFAESVTEYLRMRGYDVMHCSDGEEATEMMRHLSFDAIVSDYDLGNGPSGLSILRTAQPGATTVLWSGLDRDREVDAYDTAYQFRPNHVLTKSNIERLEEVLSDD